MEVKDDFEDLYYKSIEQRKDLEKALFDTNELMMNYLSRCLLLEKALELAVADKCKFENEWLSMVVGMPNGKLLVPKKEQWYLEQAEKEVNNGR